MLRASEVITPAYSRLSINSYQINSKNASAPYIIYWYCLPLQKNGIWNISACLLLYDNLTMHAFVYKIILFIRNCTLCLNLFYYNDSNVFLWVSYLNWWALFGPQYRCSWIRAALFGHCRPWTHPNAYYNLLRPEQIISSKYARRYVSRNTYFCSGYTCSTMHF
jgi:hypothetical protein